jgi:hypothetical protein
MVLLGTEITERKIRRAAMVVAMVPTRAPPGRSDPMDTEAIAERVKQFPWFHSIDLGNGIVTPGAKSPEIHAQETAASLVQFGWRERQ